MSVKQWKDKPIEDYGSVVSPDFKKFAREVKKEVKAMAAEDGLELYNFSVGHYYISGVLKDKGTNKFAYFNTSDVRYNNSWYDHILVRNMKHEKDWTGEQNNYTSFDKLGAMSKKLILQKIKQENLQNNKGDKSMDINVSIDNIENNKENVLGDVIVNNQIYKFDYSKKSQDVKIFNMKDGMEVPIPQIVTDNIVEITDKLKDKMQEFKEPPIAPDRLGSYRIPADRADDLHNLLNAKHIQHFFSAVKTNSKEKYVLFDKKFYPGVKAALNNLHIRKPSLSEQIAEAKSHTTSKREQAQQINITENQR